MLHLSLALRFLLSWILHTEGHLDYRLPRHVGRQSSAMMAQHGRLLINPTLAPICQQVLLYYSFRWCQQYESTRLDAEQNCKSNN